MQRVSLRRNHTAQQHKLVAIQQNFIAIDHQGFTPLLALARPLLLPCSSAQLQGVHPYPPGLLRKDIAASNLLVLGPGRSLLALQEFLDELQRLYSMPSATWKLQDLSFPSQACPYIAGHVTPG